MILTPNRNRIFIPLSTDGGLRCDYVNNNAIFFDGLSRIQETGVLILIFLAWGFLVVYLGGLKIDAEFEGKFRLARFYFLLAVLIFISPFVAMIIFG